MVCLFSYRSHHIREHAITELILSILLLSSPGILAQPLANFTSDRSADCSPLLVKFTNTSTGNPSSYFWDFGNGNTSTFANPSAVFVNPGTYTVTLRASSSAGTSLISKNIVVWAHPAAAFTTSASGGCVNDSICFTDQSLPGSAPVNQWSWDFGDGNSSSFRNPCNRYTFSDTFKVALVITDVNGCQSTLVKPSLIHISDHAVAFSQTATMGCSAPMSVTFTDQTTPSAPGYRYAWSFGNGDTAGTAAAATVYNASGKYDVTLSVTAPNGCTRTLTRPGTVIVHGLKAGFASSPQVACGSFSTRFSNTSTAADTGLLSYTWTSSAGHFSNAREAPMLFNTPGSFDIKLKVSAPGGCADSMVHPGIITLHPKTPVAFSAFDTQFCKVPAATAFTVSPSTLRSVRWIWSDSASAFVMNPLKIFNQFGSYDITLIASDTNGCVDTITKPAYIRVRPSGFRVALTPPQGCRPLAVSMHATDTGLVPLTSWQWWINDSSVAHTRNTSQVFNDTGVYIIRCTGTNAEGCAHTVYDTVRVGMETHPSFSVDKPSDCFSNATFRFSNHTNDSLPVADHFVWSMGDGGSYTGSEPVHRFSDTGMFRVMLTAIHKGCSVAVASVRVGVSAPRALFTAPPVVCFGDSITLTNSSHGGNRWTWNMGDGNLFHTRHVRYQYAAAGNYSIRMIAQDSVSGCSDTIIRTVLVPPVPTVQFTQTDSAGCPGLIAFFIDRSIADPGSIAHMRWNFGDGQWYTNDSPRVHFNKAGFHFVSLTLTDVHGCAYTHRKDSQLHIFRATPGFSVTPSIGCIPMQVNVTDTSSSEFPIVSRKWTWEPGMTETSSAVSASHVYAKAPADQNAGFMLRMSITDSKGCSYTAARNIRPGHPLPAIRSSLIKHCGLDSLKLQSDTTPAAGIIPLSFKWKLGPTETVSGPSLQRKFTTSQNLGVTLIARDSNGCIDSTSALIQIDTRKPVAGFMAVPDRLLNCPGPPIHLKDTSIEGASRIRSWTWDFGDSTKSLLKDPAKIYLEPGVYSLRLAVTDSLGCVSISERPDFIRIAGPKASFSVEPLSGCAPLDVNFHASSSNTRTFEWDLGDGIIDTQAVHAHRYVRDGMFIPNLTITDSAGCRRALPWKDTIRIHALPHPDFETDKQVLCLGGRVTFNNTSTHGRKITQYKWNLGDTNITAMDEAMLTRRYLREGVFDITLRATDSLGCTDTIRKKAAVTVLRDTLAPPVPLLHRVTVVDEGHVLAEFSRNRDSDFDFYTILYDYDEAVPNASLTRQREDTSFVQQGINTRLKSYSFSVAAKDICLNQSASSPVHTTILLRAKADTNAVALSWSAYKGWNAVGSYTIFRRDSAAATFEKIGQVSGAASSYTDTTASCFKTFHYKVKAIEAAGSRQESWSNADAATPLFENRLPSTQNIRATVVDNRFVLVQWERRTYRQHFTPVVYRAVDNGELIPWREMRPSDTVLVDEDVDVDNHSYSYVTYLKDACGSVSPASNVAKTILLSLDMLPDAGSTHKPELTWTPYSDWDTGVERYAVEFSFDSVGAYSFIANTTPDKLKYVDQSMSGSRPQYCYRVTAYRNGNPTVDSRSNRACVSTQPALYAPNAFTVNGDNLNETFRLGGIFIQQFEIHIYNRWGEQVFESHDMANSWDGTVNGQPAPADVYVFLAEGISPAGKRVTVKGTVTLLR